MTITAIVIYLGHSSRVIYLSGKKRLERLVERRSQKRSERLLSPALAKKRIFAVAKRLPDLARKTQSELESEGDDHPVIEQIVALVEQRCEMTMRRLGAAGNNDLAQWEG